MFFVRNDLVLFLNPLVYVVYKPPDARKVVLGKPFNIVMASHFNEVRLETLVERILPESMTVRNMYNFISSSVDNVDRTIEVFDPVYVRKLVKRQSPSQIVEDNSQNAHEGCVEDEAGCVILLSEEAGGS